MSKLRIGIIGLGIGGATLAAALRRRGMQATIFEQASEIREVGAGIALWPNSVRLLLRLGLADALERVGAKRLTSPIYTAQGDLLQSLETSSPLDGAPGYFVHRAELLSAIAELSPPEAIRLGARCRSVRQDGETSVVELEDGTSEAFDVVIGADGIHSVVIEAVAGTAPAATYSGLAAYRGIVPNDPAFGLTTGPLWTDNHRYFVAFPMSGGKVVNFVGVVPTAGQPDESWLREGRQEDLRREFAGWAPQVTAIIEAVQSTFRWGLYFRDPLPRIVAGRVGLIGDAAHAMLIHAGMGAGQAIEDAFALAVLLDGARSQEIPERLQLYQACRLERASAVQAMTRANALFLHRGAFGHGAAPPPPGMGETGWVIEHDAEAAAAECLAGGVASMAEHP